MAKRALVVVVATLLVVGCGKLGSGCSERSERDEPSVRERFTAHRGEFGPGEDGRSVRPASTCVATGSSACVSRFPEPRRT